MSQTKAGAVKWRATIRDRYGVDENGKSILHKIIGHQGGISTGGKNDHFSFLQLNDPERLKEITSKGGKISKRRNRGIRNENN